MNLSSNFFGFNSPNPGDFGQHLGRHVLDSEQRARLRRTSARTRHDGRWSRPDQLIPGKLALGASGFRGEFAMIWIWPFAIGWVPEGGSRTVPNEARPSSDTARPPSRCTRRGPCKPWQRHSDSGTATEICRGNASHGQRTRRSGPRLTPDVRALAVSPSPPRPTRQCLTLAGPFVMHRLLVGGARTAVLYHSALFARFRSTFVA
jgi:hypothetical protein